VFEEYGFTFKLLDLLRSLLHLASAHGVNFGFIVLRMAIMLTQQKSAQSSELAIGKIIPSNYAVGNSLRAWQSSHLKF